MRSASGVYRLSFMLPASMLLRVQPGRHSPCLHGCVLIVAPSGLVQLDGPSRGQIFEQARRFFRVHAKGLPALSIAATLATPAMRGPGGRDGWSIIVGADIAFSPTALDPDLPRPALASPQREQPARASSDSPRRDRAQAGSAAPQLELVHSAARS